MSALEIRVGRLRGVKRTVRKVVENRHVNDEETSGDNCYTDTRGDPVNTGITCPRIDECADSECNDRYHGGIQPCFCASEGEILSKRGRGRKFKKFRTSALTIRSTRKRRGDVPVELLLVEIY